MTSGPKFLFCNETATARRPTFLFSRFLTLAVTFFALRVSSMVPDYEKQFFCESLHAVLDLQPCLHQHLQQQQPLQDTRKKDRTSKTNQHKYNQGMIINSISKSNKVIHEQTYVN